MTPAPARPGGALASRPLHFVWIADCSGSMKLDGKIQALNNAIREALPHMKSVARENATAQVLVRVIRFSTGAHWHVAEPTPVQNFEWRDLAAEGVTDMGRALELAASAMTMEAMPQRALPPVLVLISDGQPTDQFEQGVQTLMKSPWGKKAVRLAVAIGEDADHEPLQKFIGDPSIRPLQANYPEALVSHIRWVSTAAIASVSAPAVPGGAGLANIFEQQTQRVPTASHGEIEVW